jgi:hypothetical protein
LQCLVLKKLSKTLLFTALSSLFLVIRLRHFPQNNSFCQHLEHSCLNNPTLKKQYGQRPPH